MNNYTIAMKKSWKSENKLNHDINESFNDSIAFFEAYALGCTNWNSVCVNTNQIEHQRALGN